MPIEKSEGRAATADTTYEHLTALFAELVELDQGSPRRAELRDRLVTAHLPLAHRVARRFSHRGEPQDDLEQVASVGLIHAVDRFEPARGSDFLSFAARTPVHHPHTAFLRRPDAERDRATGWAVADARLPPAVPDAGPAAGRVTQ